MFNKLQILRDIRSQQKTNKSLSQPTRNVEIEQAAIDKAHREVTRRSQTLESDLRRAKQDCESCSPSSNVWKRKTA
jgi:hypothetical protein